MEQPAAAGCSPTSQAAENKAQARVVRPASAGSPRKNVRDAQNAPQVPVPLVPWVLSFLDILLGPSAPIFHADRRSASSGYRSLDVLRLKRK